MQSKPVRRVHSTLSRKHTTTTILEQVCASFMLILFTLKCEKHAFED